MDGKVMLLQILQEKLEDLVGSRQEIGSNFIDIDDVSECEDGINIVTSEGDFTIKIEDM